MDEQAHFHPKDPPTSKPYPPREVEAQEGLPKARLTVVGHAYHQVSNDQPTDVPTKGQLALTSDEQPYVRKLRVGPEWKFLETGWIEECSCVLIRNDCTKKTLYLSTDPVRNKPDWKILPGLSMLGSPHDLGRLRLSGDDVKATLVVYPK